jgi:hypothetical protein
MAPDHAVATAEQEVDEGERLFKADGEGPVVDATILRNQTRQQLVLSVTDEHALE